MVIKGEKGKGGINQEFGINICTLLDVKQIINKALKEHLLSSITTYMGKKS